MIPLPKFIDRNEGNAEELERGIFGGIAELARQITVLKAELGQEHQKHETVLAQVREDNDKALKLSKECAQETLKAKEEAYETSLHTKDEACRKDLAAKVTECSSSINDKNIERQQQLVRLNTDWQAKVAGKESEIRIQKAGFDNRLESMQKELDDRNARITQLESERRVLDDVRGQKSELERQLASAREDSEKQTVKIQNLERGLAASQMKCSLLEEEKTKLDTNLADCEETFQGLQLDYAQLVGRNEVYELTQQELREHNENLVGHMGMTFDEVLYNNTLIEGQRTKHDKLVGEFCKQTNLQKGMLKELGNQQQNIGMLAALTFSDRQAQSHQVAAIRQEHGKHLADKTRMAGELTASAQSIAETTRDSDSVISGLQIQMRSQDAEHSDLAGKMTNLYNDALDKIDRLRDDIVDLEGALDE